MQRYESERWGVMLRHKYDDVGFPWRNTMGSPSPTSSYAIVRPRTLIDRFVMEPPVR